MAQFGIRILGIPEKATERQLKIHFRNPRHGGGRISKLYYPLLNNDAVIYFEDMTENHELLTKEQIFQGQALELQILPRTIFSQVTVHLDSGTTNFLDENSEYLDNLQFDGDLIVTFDSETMSYHMSGTWYQVEWAWAYLEGIHSRQSTNVFDKTPFVADDDETVEKRTMSQQRETKGKKNVASRKIETCSKRNVLFGKDHTGSLKEKQSRTNISWDLKTHKSYSTYGGTQGTFEKKSGLMAPSRTYHEFDLSHKMPDKRGNHNNEDTVNVKSNTGAMGLNPFSINAKSDYHRSNKSLQGNRNHHRNAENSDSNDEVTDDSTTVNIDDIPKMSKFMNRSPKSCLSITRSDFQDVPLTYQIDIAAVTITVLLGDLIQQKTDAIVSPANSDLSNRFGIAAALARAAGQNLQKECRSFIEKNGNLFIGDVVHTCAGGMLDKHVGFVLHAVGPTWREKYADQTAHLLTCTYLNCFQYANKQLWLKSLSLPLISTGVFGVPLDVCVQAFYDAIHLHVSDNRDSRHLVDVKLLSNDQDSACASIVVLRSLMDTKEEEARQSSIERYKNQSIKYEFMARDFYLNSDIEEHLQNGKENLKGSSSDANSNGEEEAQQRSTNEEYESKKEVHVLERDTLELIDDPTVSACAVPSGISRVDSIDDSKDENRNSDEENSQVITKNDGVKTTCESFAVEKNPEDEDNYDNGKCNNNDGGVDDADVSSITDAAAVDDYVDDDSSKIAGADDDVSSNIAPLAAEDDDDDDDDDDDENEEKYIIPSTNSSTKKTFNEYINENEEIEDKEEI